MKPEELDKAGLVQWPQVIGGIVPVVNLDGMSAGRTHARRPTLAKIFLGEIKSWDDPAIKKLNPKASSCRLRRSPSSHRSDGSGTTFNFTNYLSKVSPDWKAKVGDATAVEWPVGIGAKGNEGVANNVIQTKGAIGYVEYAYAMQNKMTYVKMVNKDGKVVAPTTASFQAAAANADWAQGAGFLCDPDRRAGRQILADHRRDLHPVAQAAAGRRRDGRGAEILRLGLRQGRPRRPRSSTIFRCPRLSSRLIKKTWATEIKDSDGKPLAN